MDKRIRYPRIYRGTHQNLELNVCAYKQGNISGDHLAVRFAVHASKPARLRKVVTFR